MNTLDHPTGALRRVSTCATHKAQQRDPAALDEAYYRELGVIGSDGRMLDTRHVAELTEALGSIPPAQSDRATALEIGCGASPYVGAIQSAGYRYQGQDPSLWAVEFVRSQPGARAFRAAFEGLSADWHESRFGFILAAHVFEHLADAPAAIAKAARILAPSGELWIVVPDDSDPVNPDHVWLFTADSLRRIVEAAGLSVLRLETRRHVAHENFLYLRAIKS